MNFVIYAPGDYTPNGGGCVALHKLAHNISLCGEKSFIMTSKKNPDYLGEQVTEAEARGLCIGGHGIAIYPEVTCGNPFQSEKVMRWILYYVREHGCHGMFGANDLIYLYAPHFTLRYPHEIHGELRAFELNLDIFQNRNQERSGSCYLVKKNPDKVHFHPEDSIKLDDYPTKGGNQYLADNFNRCEIFYSYDSATWLSVMASLCGCVSLVIPDAGVSAEEWHNKFPYFKYGIAYGNEDLPYALATNKLLKPELLKLEAETLELTKQFIKKAYEL